MSDCNVVVIEGHLTSPASLSRFQDGTAYCNFTVANNETYKGQDGEYHSIASFFDCTVKGAYAEAMSKHLIKGRALTVTGRLKQQVWEKDGQKRSRVIINVKDIHLRPMMNNEGQQVNQVPKFEQKEEQKQGYSFEEEEIPNFPFNENEGEEIPF